MNCEELRAKLDAYMDGELSVVDLREMEAHAATCEDCRRELEAARLVRDALAALPDEVPVPLETQAKWRRAVRAEAAQNGFTREVAGKPKRWLRAVYAVAAALVLVLSASAMLGRSSDARRVEVEPMTASIDQGIEEAVPMVAAALPTEAVVASDGSTDDAAIVAEEAAVRDESYAAWRKFATPADDDSHRAACETVEALVEEYSGRFELLPIVGSTSYYRVELPSEYMNDFLSAVSHVGEELESETREPEGDAAIVYILLEQPGAD